MNNFNVHFEVDMFSLRGYDHGLKKLKPSRPLQRLVWAIAEKSLMQVKIANISGGNHNK